MTEWIRSKDRLPDEKLPGEDQETYLIYCPDLEKDEDFPGHAIMISNPVYLRVQALKGFVTHWMPLPKPPEEGV